MSEHLNPRIVTIQGQGVPLNYLSGWDYSTAEEVMQAILEDNPEKANEPIFVKPILTLYFFSETGRPSIDIQGEEATDMYNWLMQNNERFF